MASLFDTLTINKMVLGNRFIRSATMDGLGDQGMVSEFELNLYRELGRGGIGLIISHGLFPTQEGKCADGQLSAHTDAAIPSLSRLVDAVHENHGKIAAQILHGGWMCRPETTGLPPVGPSAMVHPRSGLPIRELSSDEVYKLVEDYVQATRRIIEAGFDGVQLHGAHSWLLSAFLSQVTNKREDEWGGTTEKRTNLLRHICRGIRRLAGPDYPIMVKLGIKDYHPEGKSISDGIEQAKLLEVAEVDSIEVSEGLEQDFFHHIRLDAVSPYYVDECRQVKQALSIPVMLVGGIRKLSDMRAVIEEGTADAVSMCRPFIMDPYLVKNLREGAISGSRCSSCNVCSGARRKPGELSCVLI
jgi:2,4-dienoyl-CoA reductase-like NADH-dependent reductase (Old Yellow Enzyme family)